MASNVQPCYHSRSNSLPSRPHHVTSDVEEHLSRLTASASAYTSSTSISHKLDGLKDLHDCIDKLLQLPNIQRALAQEQQRKLVDQLLDGTLRIIDVCSTAKDALLQTKESMQELQSMLRRRRETQTQLANYVRKYLSSRKEVEKAIFKALKNLNQKGNKCSISVSGKDCDTGAVISILQETEALTLNVMESLLFFISGPEAELKMKRWSVVSRLLHTKRVGCEGEPKLNEIANAEAILLSLLGCKTGKSEDYIIQMESAQNEQHKSELCIQDLEEGLEFLFRRLIKVRVTILNILNH